MLRPLFVCPNGEFGGGERTAINFGLGLSKLADVEPHFILLRTGVMEQELNRLGIPFEITDTFRLSKPLQWRKIVRQIKHYAQAQSVSLIHSEMAYGHLVGSVAARQMGLPCTWYQHGPVDPRSWMQIAAALAPTDCLITNSKFTVTTQPRRSHISRIEVVPPPVSPDFFDREPCGETVRDELSLGSQDILLLAPGRFQSWKGQEMALKAFPEIAGKYGNVHLAFVGKPDRKDHRDYPEYLNLVQIQEKYPDAIRRKIHFFSFTADIIPYLDAADIVLHCSQIPEPFGCVITESMARKRVVVAANDGGAKEILQNGEFGYVYDLASVESFQSTVAKALGDQNAWSALRDRALLRAKSYHADETAKKLQSIFLDIAATN